MPTVVGYAGSATPPGPERKRRVTVTVAVAVGIAVVLACGGMVALVGPFGTVPPRSRATPWTRQRTAFGVPYTYAFTCNGRPYTGDAVGWGTTMTAGRGRSARSRSGRAPTGWPSCLTGAIKSRRADSRRCKGKAHGTAVGSRRGAAARQ